MFTDYLILMLVNMAAAMLVLAHFLVFGLDGPTRKPWAAPLGACGLVALVTGLHMSLTWPLPGSFNGAFGETSVLLGAILLALALAAGKEWHLLPVGVMALLPGALAVAIGIRIYDLHLTMKPELTLAGFVLTGSLGVLATPVILLRRYVAVRAIAGLIALAAAAVWALTGILGGWAHLSVFLKYVPTTMPK
jgi:putative membrane protein